MQEHIRAAITLLAVINPVICGVMLLQVDDGSSLKHRLYDATKAALAVLTVLVLSALLGKYILQIFGISIDVFKIVGGVIIAFIGFGMFGGKSPSGEGEQKPKETLSTLIMFAASPGTIATVIALSVVHTAAGLPIVALVGIVSAVFLTWIVMLVMLLAAGRFHQGGQQMFTRFLGLILIAMGLQYVLTGLKDFMVG
jgi:multiple antibiotic resistance protein